jgi:hypothetical protein
MSPYLAFAVAGLARGSPAADRPEPLRHDRLIRTLAFASLTEDQAMRLDGRRARFLVVVEPLTEDEEAGQGSSECKGTDEVYRTIWLRAGQEVQGPVEVEATLRVLRFRPQHFQDGTFFAGFTEYRLLRARPCR